MVGWPDAVPAFVVLLSCSETRPVQVCKKTSYYQIRDYFCPRAETKSGHETIAILQCYRLTWIFCSVTSSCSAICSRSSKSGYCVCAKTASSCWRCSFVYFVRTRFFFLGSPLSATVRFLFTPACEKNLHCIFSVRQEKSCSGLVSRPSAVCHLQTLQILLACRRRTRKGLGAGSTRRIEQTLYLRCSLSFDTHLSFASPQFRGGDSLPWIPSFLSFHPWYLEIERPLFRSNTLQFIYGWNTQFASS